MSHRQKKQGYTITELLIVLAIAGLILTMIFYAVPALNRNSNNNRRKQDVETILLAVSNYRLRTTGSFPTSLASTRISKLNYYEESNIKFNQAERTIVPTINSVFIYDRAKCNGNDITSNNAGSRDIVAYYSIDTGRGGSATQCKQL